MKPRASSLQKVLATGMFCAAFLMSLFDFYFVSYGISPFPILGLLLLQPILFFYARRTANGNVQRQLETTGFGLAMIAFYFASAFWGWFAFGGIYFKAAIGMSLGIIIFLNLLLREDNRLFRETLFHVVNLLLVVHLIFFLVQVLYFLSTTTPLDYIQPISGMATRSKFNRGIGVELMRFTGLFAEPAIYATFVYMGISVRLLANKFRWRVFDFILAGSVMVSLSVIGIAMLGLLVVVSALFDRRSAILFSTVFGISIPTLATLVFAVETPISMYLRLRFTKPLDDSSGNERMMRGFTEFAQSTDVVQVMGKGLGNYDMSPGVSNGLAYLLEYFGALGTFFFFALLFLYFVRRRTSVMAILFLIATLAGTPLFTNIYWWFWVTMLLIFSSHPIIETESENSALPAPLPH